MKFTIFFCILFYLACDSHHETREKTAIVAQPKTQAPIIEKKNTLITGPEITTIPKDHPLPKKTVLSRDASAPFTARNLDFSMTFFKHLSQSEKSNFIFSPITLAKNMALMHAGAEGESKKEIENVMHFDFSDEDAFYAYFGGRKFSWTKRKALLDNINIFVPQELQLKLRARKILGDFLHESIHATPFSDPEKAHASINSFGGIGDTEPLLAPKTLAQHAQLVFSSSLYYHGAYTNYRGLANDKGFMKRQTPRIAYAKVDGVIAIELESDGKVLFILMPKDFQNFEEKTLNAAFVRSVKIQLKSKEVNLSMEGFKVHTQGNVVPLFHAMGIKKAFSDKADFSALSYEALKVDAILHQNDFSFSVDLRPEMFKRKFNLKIDKPFFFMLEDKEEGTLFFMGAIKDLKGAATPALPSR